MVVHDIDMSLIHIHGKDISTMGIQSRHGATCNSATGHSPCLVELNGTQERHPLLFFLEDLFSSEVSWEHAAGG